MLAGTSVESVEEATHAATTLRGRGVGPVVVKCGDHGALVHDERGPRAVPVPMLRVDVVDTTGDGECFDGALAVALAEGRA